MIKVLNQAVDTKSVITRLHLLLLLSLLLLILVPGLVKNIGVVDVRYRLARRTCLLFLLLHVDALVEDHRVQLLDLNRFGEVVLVLLFDE